MIRKCPILLIVLIFVRYGSFGQVQSQGHPYQGYVHFTFWMTPNVDSITPVDLGLDQTLTLKEHYLIEVATRSRFVNGRPAGEDTTGYYFIDLKNRMYAKYGSLKADAKVLEHGNLSNKKLGLAVYVTDMFADASSLALKDTIIENKNFKTVAAVDENGLFRLTALISPQPQYFPLQVSRSLSHKTNGGFIKRWTYTSIKERDQVAGEVRYEERILPESMSQLISVWEERLKEL